MVQEELQNVHHKVALAMIVKGTADEATYLDAALESIVDFVDGIYLNINHKPGDKVAPEVVKVAEKYQATYEITEWAGFGDARRKSFELVPKEMEWIVWLDADDTITNPDKIQDLINNTPPTTNGVYLSYQYDQDEYGNVTVEHYVARLVKNNGSFKWSDKVVHESLEPVRNGGKAVNEDIKVVHHASEDRKDASLERNIIALEAELEKEGDNPDPRTLFYLGRTYLAVDRLDEAAELFQSYLKLSGWREERAEAWLQLAEIHRKQERYIDMRTAILYAMGENPADPTPFVEMGSCEMMDEMWERAIIWLEMAVVKKVGPTTMVNYTSDTKYRNYMYLAQCNFKLGKDKVDLALKWADLAYEMKPDETTANYRQLIKSTINLRKKAEKAVEKLQRIAERNPKRIPREINKLPEELQDNPAILRIRRRYVPAKVWPKNSIVIFIGNSLLGEWGPWSLAEGIGGSEEAVIRLGRQLVERGWDVTVYATPGPKAGTYDGVHYRNYWEASLDDTFDVFVSWRSPWFFDVKIKARKKYLWLHDVMDKEEFTQERIDNLDKVIVLSKYHRSLFPMIPDEKIFLSANGIDPDDFAIYDDTFERDPHRIVYMSSHVRGLQMLYEVWERVKKAVPDAKLDVYYGKESFVKVNRDNPERMGWLDMMTKWEQELPDVKDHGKISQEQIVKEIFQAGVWAYPCPFPEISCITAIKAQAGGAIPVSSNFAALDETVQFGVKLPMKPVSEKTPVGKWDKEDLANFERELIAMLRDEKRQESIRPEMMKWAREQSWANIAKQWEGEFNGT